MLRIASHQLVRSLTGHHHFHAARGELRQHEDRNIGGLTDRRAATEHGGLPILHEGVRIDNQFPMIGAELFGDEARMIELGILSLAKADREGANRH